MLAALAFDPRHPAGFRHNFLILLMSTPPTPYAYQSALMPSGITDLA